jgi:1-acyl-sn-glycerol-3-phosphate acyltransferase
MLRHILVSTGIILDTFILGLIYIFLSPIDFKGKIFDFLSRNWSKIILFISGVKVKIIGIGNINKNRSYIVVSNHQSLFDIPVIIANFPLSVRMIAKKELFWIPIFGWAIYIAGHISIDRGSGRKAKRSLEKALEKISKKRFSVVVYPEGTRSPDGEVKEFGKGAFRLAFESKLPILPVAIKDSRKVLPRGSLRINRGEIKIVIGKPISTENIEKRELNKLKDKVRSEIMKSMEIEV